MQSKLSSGHHHRRPALTPPWRSPSSFDTLYPDLFVPLFSPLNIQTFPRVISLTPELRVGSKLHPSLYTVFCLASAPLPRFDNLAHLQWARVCPILYPTPTTRPPKTRAIVRVAALISARVVRPARCLVNYESSQSDNISGGDEFVGISAQRFLSFSSTTTTISESHSTSHLKHDLLPGVPANFLSRPQKAVTAHCVSFSAFRITN